MTIVCIKMLIHFIFLLDYFFIFLLTKGGRRGKEKKKKIYAKRYYKLGAQGT